MILIQFPLCFHNILKTFKYINVGIFWKPRKGTLKETAENVNWEKSTTTWIIVIDYWGFFLLRFSSVIVWNSFSLAAIRRLAMSYVVSLMLQT